MQQEGRPRSVLFVPELYLMSRSSVLMPRMVLSGVVAMAVLQGDRPEPGTVYSIAVQQSPVLRRSMAVPVRALYEISATLKKRLVIPQAARAVRH
eukprot:2912109-Rhodomonas_salina.1